MAQFDATDFSSRKLQGRRYTGLPFDSQEAFTSTIDIQSSEILTDDRYIPTGSLPFSGSSQHEFIVSRSFTDPSLTGDSDGNVLRYYYRHKLTRATGNDINRETFYFLKDEPATAGTKISSDQLITGSQFTNFINNKNIGANEYATLGAGDAENALGAGLAYNVIVYKSTDSDKNNVTVGDVVDAGDYVFDYKTGILSFTSDNAVNPDSGEFIYMTAYRYVGRTLRSQLIDGSLGSGGGSGEGAISSSAQIAALGAGILSSSAQIASEISGAFTSTSSSLAADITTNTSNITTNTNNITSLQTSASIGIHFMTSSAVAGTSIGLAGTASFGASGTGLSVDESNGTITYTLNTSSLTVASSDTIAVTNDATTNQYFGVVFANNTGSGISLKSDGDSGYGLTYNPSTNALRIGAEANRSINIAVGDTAHNLTADQAGDTVNIFTTSQTVNVGTSAITFTLGSDSAISTTTLNGHTVNVGRAEGTVNILGSASIAGDLIVQGSVTSIQTENLNVSDQFILLASGSIGTKDGGIIVQSGSNGVGTALYFDANANRWAVNPANTVNWNDTALTPKQYVVSVSASAASPTTTPQDFGSTNEYYGMMHVNTDNGEIWIYS